MLQQQRSFKVVMNSVYGFLGASRGFIPCVPIAASVTATGRKMIEHTAQRTVELLPGSEVVYGDTDSVMVKMKLPDDKVHDMDEQFKMAKWLAGEITKDFRAPNDLEVSSKISKRGMYNFVICDPDFTFLKIPVCSSR